MTIEMVNRADMLDAVTGLIAAYDSARERYKRSADMEGVERTSQKIVALQSLRMDLQGLRTYEWEG